VVACLQRRDRLGVATREAGEATYAYHPGENRTKIPHKVYALPPQAELLNQSFAGITPDPTERWGEVWSVGGKWSGLGPNVRFGDVSGKSFAELRNDKAGKGARLTGSVAYDMSDHRLKNRLRGHFPASPVAYGVADGVVELSMNVRRPQQSAVLQVALKPDSKSAESVGFSVARDGATQVQSSISGDAQSASLILPQDQWQRVTLRLNFKTAKATLIRSDTPGAPAGEVSFDANKHYRMIVLGTAGEPETGVQVGDLRMTQAFE